MIPATDPDAVRRGPALSGTRPRGLARALGGWLAVMVTAVAVLRILDLLPGVVSGKPRGVTSVTTVEDAERSLRARLLLPGVFPDTLRWPPAAVDIYAGPPAAAAVMFEGATSHDVRLIVCQTVEPAADVPPRLLPPGLILTSARTNVGDQPGTLTRIQLDDGRIVHEVTWQTDGRALAVRFDGTVEQLMTLARSLKAGRL